MKAAYIERYGRNDVVKLGGLPKPELRPADLLVGVKAASVNSVDFKTRDGRLKLIRPYRFPLILGGDLSGVVIETGAAVTRFKPGDEYSRGSIKIASARLPNWPRSARIAPL